MREERSKSRARSPIRSPSAAFKTKALPSRACLTSTNSIAGLLSRPQSGTVSRDEHLADAEQLDQNGDHENPVELADLEPELAIRFNVEREILSLSSLDEALLPHGIADYTLLPEDAGGLLGKGKFSAVYVASKAGQEYAIKHTPLHNHHQLIASRLLREPTILAQLPPHSNLIKVYEIIRTPGHFYLIEEYFKNYISLEDYVSKHCSNGRLPEKQACLILHQLVDVVRNALHRPIFIAHRDIKPENMLVDPVTLHLLILDFGLATHFSEKEPKLTTCCGSPAFHSPELWLSLKSPPGNVRYWGPEIDIWCIGVSMLRCISGQRCPLGTSHSSLQHLSEKVIDAVLGLPPSLQQPVAALLEMDGRKRMQNFVDFKGWPDIVLPARPIQQHDRDFKSTTFIPTPPKHALHLPLWQPPADGQLTQGSPEQDSDDTSHSKPWQYRSLDQIHSSIDAGALAIKLSNPSRQSASRVVSFIKYAFRCKGIIYHVSPENTAATNQNGSSDDVLSMSAATIAIRPIYIQCAIIAPAKTSEASAFRPSLRRAATEQVRNTSMPPLSKTKSKKEAKKISVLPFWLSLSLLVNARSKGKQRKAKIDFSTIVPTSIVVRVSDSRAFDTVLDSLKVGMQEEAVIPSESIATPLPDDRGRPSVRRSATAMHLSTPERGKSVDALNLFGKQSRATSSGRLVDMAAGLFRKSEPENENQAATRPTSEPLEAVPIPTM